MPYTRIPVLPVLAPINLVAIPIVIWVFRRHGNLTAPRGIVSVVTCIYVAGVLDRTLFPFPTVTDHEKSWRVWFNLTLFVDVVADPIGVILIVALFVPLGVLLPLVARLTPVRHMVLGWGVIHPSIETIQLVADITVSIGRIADVDDLIGNTVVTLIGYIMFRLVTLIPGASHMATQAT